MQRARSDERTQRPASGIRLIVSAVCETASGSLIGKAEDRTIGVVMLLVLVAAVGALIVR
jgi:hypothetical protein